MTSCANFRIDDVWIPLTDLDTPRHVLHLQVVVRNLWQPLVILQEINEFLNLPKSFLIKFAQYRRIPTFMITRQELKSLQGKNRVPKFLLMEIPNLLRIKDILTTMIRTSVGHQRPQGLPSVRSVVVKQLAALRSKELIETLSAISWGLTFYVTTLALRAGHHGLPMCCPQVEAEHETTMSPMEEGDDHHCEQSLSWDPTTFEPWELLDHLK
jgi:hypothetical protein